MLCHAADFEWASVGVRFLDTSMYVSVRYYVCFIINLIRLNMINGIMVNKLVSGKSELICSHGFVAHMLMMKLCLSVMPLGWEASWLGSWKEG